MILSLLAYSKTRIMLKPSIDDTTSIFDVGLNQVGVQTINDGENVYVTFILIIGRRFLVQLGLRYIYRGKYKLGYLHLR
jgi:hypothetical protein